MASQARMRSTDGKSTIEFELVDDDTRSIGPTFAVRVSSRGFAGVDECVVFHESAWRAFLGELAEPGQGRARLLSATYEAAGEGLELICSPAGSQGPWRVRATLQRLVLVGKEWDKQRVDVALELDAQQHAQALGELRLLVP